MLQALPPIFGKVQSVPLLISVTLISYNEKALLTFMAALVLV